MLTLSSLFKWRLVTAFFCFICLAYLGTVIRGSLARIAPAPSATTHHQGITPYLTNKTNALRVMSVKTIGEGSRTDVEITLKNQSNENITAYVLSMGDVSVTTQIGFDGEPFAPNHMRVEKIPFDNVTGAAQNNPARAGEIVLSAVFLANGTGEGEPRWVAKIKNKYMGMKDEVQIILPLLRSTSNSHEPDLERSLVALEAHAAELPQGKEKDKLSFDYQDGRSYVKEGLKSNIKYLKDKKKVDRSFNHRDELNVIIAHYERFLATL